MKRIYSRILSHPNLLIVAVSLIVIATIGVGTYLATSDLENRLVGTVFRANALASHSVGLRLKEYIEGRGVGVRTIAGVLAGEKSFDARVRDINNYFMYVKTMHIYAVFLFSKDGKVIFSTNARSLGADFKTTKFWQYVRQVSGNSNAIANFGQGFYPILPFVGSADTSNNGVLIGEPILKKGKNGDVQFDGAFAALVNQHELIGSPAGDILSESDSTFRVALGFYSKTGFPFVHILSNVPEWNKGRVRNIQRVGLNTCISCHEKASLDEILGGKSQTGTASFRPNARTSTTGTFLWTSSKMTSSNVVLQDSIWYVVVGADRGPVQASINSYIRGSLILMLGTIILLVVVFSLNFYGYRRQTLKQQEMEHLQQVADLRKQYELLIEGSNDGIYILSEGKPIFANKKFQELVGYTMDELATLDSRKLVAPESLELFDERVRKVRDGEEIESRYGFYALTKNGKKTPVETSVTNAPYEGKMRTIGIVRDLSEVTAQRQLYEELFNNAPIGLGIYKGLKAVKINQAAAVLLGYDTPNDLINLDIVRFIHPDIFPMARERMRRAAEEKIPAPPAEEVFVRRDGSLIHVLVLSQPVIYEGEDAVQIAFVSLEDQRQLEQNLAREAAQQEEEKIRLETLLQNLDEGILFQGAEGKIEFANAEFCRISGFEEPAQVIGKTPQEVLTHASVKVKYPDEFKKQISRDIEHKESNKGTRVEYADGSIIEGGAVPLFDTANKYIGRLTVLRDITQRERSEETIKRLQRTELLGRLAGGIAHDFNNVLGVIIGSLQLILRKVDNPNVVRENTERALSSAKRGAEVAKRLLQFVRYSPEGFAVFSLRQLLDETVSIIKHTFPENISVDTQYMLHDSYVFGSVGDIQQVLINLANNSRDAMPNGGTLTVSLTTADSGEIEKRLGSSPSAKYALLMIQDTGYGIEEEKMGKIFDPFFTTKDIGKGTGLGLSIVQTIISAHSGFIEVKSRPGKGTTFFVYLPMSNEKPVAIESETKHEGNEMTEPKETATVLVVEDEEALRELLYQYLSENGFNVIGASDGEEGFKIFEHHPEIRVVLSDLGLPKLAGDKLIAKIKSNRPDVKCILATGYLTPAADDSLSNTEVRMIMKPYNLVAIHSLLTEVLSAKK